MKESRTKSRYKKQETRKTSHMSNTKKSWLRESHKNKAFKRAKIQLKKIAQNKFG